MPPTPQPEWRDLILAGELMTTAQAARYCGVQPITIQKWWERGHLRRLNEGSRTPLYLRTELDRCDEKRQEIREYQRNGTPAA